MADGIPPAQIKPKSVPLPDIGQYQILIFSMETTGFYRRNQAVSDHITHLAAVKVKELASSEGALAASDDGSGLTSETNVFFSKFVMPTKPYSEEAAEKCSNIKIYFELGQMHFHDNPVSEVLEIRTMLEQLCEFIGDQPAVLYGHNIKSFGCHVLLNAALACDMYDQLCDKIVGFVDTRYWFSSSVWKDRKQDLKQYAEQEQPKVTEGEKPTSYSLHTLQGFFKVSSPNPECPDALEKVKALYRLIKLAENDTHASEYSFTFQYVKETREYSIQNNTA